MLAKTRKVLCLDWDKRSLRIVVAKISGGKMVLEDAHAHRLPDDLDADDSAAMGEYIQQMLRHHRLRSKWVLVDVARERAVINQLALPPTPPEEVAAAVRFQALRELPFPLESAAADYVITQRDDEGRVTEALLAAVTNETLESVKATCAAAGLTPARIGLRPYANLVSARHVMDLNDRHILFVDVGAGATEIDVFARGALAFARSANVHVPVPSLVTDPEDESRIISLSTVDDLDTSDQAIDAAIDELLVEVTRTLQAYRATEPDAAIDGIVVAGGTGIETQLAELLERRMHYPVSVFDPTAPLGLTPDEGAKLRSFSAALGLAWGLGREGLLALDFLNPKRPVSPHEALKKRARVIGLAAAVVLAAVGGGLGRWYFQLAQQHYDLANVNNKLEEELNDKTLVRYQIERAREWALAAVWPEELLTITAAAIEPGKEMLVQGMNLESGRNHEIMLKNVYATDWQVPLDYVRRLNEVAVDDKRVYDAQLGTWNEISSNSDFSGKLDIRVELRRLVEEYEKLDERETKRRRDERRIERQRKG